MGKLVGRPVHTDLLRPTVLSFPTSELGITRLFLYQTFSHGGVWGLFEEDIISGYKGFLTSVISGLLYK